MRELTTSVKAPVSVSNWLTDFVVKSVVELLVSGEQRGRAKFSYKDKAYTNLQTADFYHLEDDEELMMCLQCQYPQYEDQQ